MLRRLRKADSLARLAAVRAVLDELRARCPDLFPASPKRQRQLLAAVRHVERYPASDARGGRPSRFRREDLLEVARQLRAALSRRCGDRVSVATFITFYLPILDWPADVVAALERGAVTKIEAALLARLTPERLRTTVREARRLRQEVLGHHIQTQGSQNSLRRRVGELLAPESAVTSGEMAAAVERVDDLLRVAEDDKRHLFYEQMKEFFFALRDIRPEDVDDASLGEILAASDQLMTVIQRLRSRRRRTEAA
jgi:hypothetical protein